MRKWTGEGTDTQQRRAAAQHRVLVVRKVVEDPERSSLVEDPACPRRASRHEAVAAHEVDVAGRGLWCRVGMWLIVGQDVSVGVASDECDVVEGGEHLEHLDRMWSEENQITECPPTVDAEACAVFEDRLQRVGNAMDVGDDPEPHDVTVMVACAFRRPPV